MSSYLYLGTYELYENLPTVLAWTATASLPSRVLGGKIKKYKEIWRNILLKMYFWHLALLCLPEYACCYVAIQSYMILCFPCLHHNCLGIRRTLLARDSLHYRLAKVDYLQLKTTKSVRKAQPTPGRRSSQYWSTAMTWPR